MCVGYHVVRRAAVLGDDGVFIPGPVPCSALDGISCI